MPASAGNRSTPTSAPSTARAAASAISQASVAGRTGSRRAPSATLVRHSPSAATRLTAPTTRPPAITTRRSKPRGATSFCARAPVAWYHGRVSRYARVRSIASSSSQRITSRPQEPKRGLKTSGGSSSGSGSHGATCSVRGCGTPASNNACAVMSLSWAATSVRRPLSTDTPAAARRSRAQSPGSTPSSDSRTSRRPRATSPGPSRASACAGVRTPPSRVFVGVAR